ncbi:MAG: putative DNA binding domain-containing protein [Oscillospiraceae bacterium]|nr:putative DNA binding domain-containing protein [Oscillospiraceae bacterium]
MIEITDLNKYQENNRIEAKKAAGGLPNSVWETYSAFANTQGGIILLGVIEREDKSLEIFGVNEPEKMIKEFWDIVNNKNKTSVNLLTDKNVEIKELDGKKIICINVPRAYRHDKPVYIGRNPLEGSFRRNWEGDYKCSDEEVRAMLRDASYQTSDMLVIEEMNMDVFNYESIHSYRMRMKYSRPGHVWESLEDGDFLLRLGAVGRGSDGSIHPTAAGLVMFGNEFEIVREFPDYFLDYRECYDENRWTDRIVSTSGEWSGNIYDFYFRVYNKLIQDIKTPFKMEKGIRIDDSPVHSAIREALANCLINADYHGRQGIVVIKNRDQIRISNPGGFRIDIETAKSGGVSDPRNTTLMKMFNLIDIGERAGSGIPNIYDVWNKQKWNTPILAETFEPERIKFVLPIGNIGKVTINSDDKKVTINSDDKKMAINSDDKKMAITSKKNIDQKHLIIEFIQEYGSAKSSELCDLLGVKSSRIKQLLRELIDEDVLVANGGNRNRTYSLKG